MTTMSPPISKHDAERLFFTGITVAIAIVILVGFARTFFLRFLFPEAQSLAAPEPIFVVHGIVFAAWTGFLILQALLIRGRRIDLHRALGWVGVGIAILMILIGTYGSLLAANRPGGFIGAPVPPFQFLVFPLFDMLLFGLFVALAIGWRKNGAKSQAPDGTCYGQYPGGGDYSNSVGIHRGGSTIHEPWFVVPVYCRNHHLGSPHAKKHPPSDSVGCRLDNQFIATSYGNFSDTGLGGNFGLARAAGRVMPRPPRRLLEANRIRAGAS